MEVSGLISGGAFCQDMGDIYLGHCGTAPATIYFSIKARSGGNKLTELEEVYYPQGGDEHIIISGLGELAEPYFEWYDEEDLQQLFNPSQECRSLRTSVFITMTVVQDGVTIGTFYQQLFSANSRTKVYPSTYNYFLSRFKTRTAYEDMPLIFGFIGRGQTLDCEVIYYDNSGDPQTQVLQLNVADTVIADDYSGDLSVNEYIPSDLANRCGVTVDKLVRITFRLHLDNRIIDKLTYNFDHNYTMERTMFLYKNVFGVPEIIAMTGQNKRSSELDATYAWISRKYRKVSTDLMTQHTICSGYIDKVTHEAIKDAIKSDKAYIIENMRIADMATITDIDLDYETPRTTPLAAYLTYRVADRVQETFVREAMDGGEEEEGIFDLTFDDTFE